MALSTPHIRPPLIYRSTEGITFEEPSKTQQHFKDECDINNIVRRYSATGTVTHVSARLPQYGDFHTEHDFHSAMTVVAEARNLFSTLSAEVRDRFNNDPANMLKFLENEDNRDEAIKLGLVAKPQVATAPPNPPPAPPPQPEGAKAPSGTPGQA